MGTASPSVPAFSPGPDLAKTPDSLLGLHPAPSPGPTLSSVLDSSQVFHLPRPRLPRDHPFPLAGCLSRSLPTSPGRGSGCPA